MYPMRTRHTALGCAAMLVLVLALAACGGGGGNETTTTAAAGMTPQKWATGVCSSFTTWQNSLESIKTDVTAQPSKSQIQKAGQQFQQATKTLVQSLKQLGAPETTQGQAAKQNLDTIAATLESGMNKIDDALSSSSGVLTQISTISATLATMASNLKLAGGNLEHLAPSGELRQAFQQASACQTLVH